MPREQLYHRGLRFENYPYDVDTPRNLAFPVGELRPWEIPPLDTLEGLENELSKIWDLKGLVDDDYDELAPLKKFSERYYPPQDSVLTKNDRKTKSTATFSNNNSLSMSTLMVKRAMPSHKFMLNHYTPQQKRVGPSEIKPWRTPAIRHSASETKSTELKNPAESVPCPVYVTPGEEILAQESKDLGHPPDDQVLYPCDSQSTKPTGVFSTRRGSSSRAMSGCVMSTKIEPETYLPQGPAAQQTLHSVATASDLEELDASSSTIGSLGCHAVDFHENVGSAVTETIGLSPRIMPEVSQAPHRQRSRMQTLSSALRVAQHLAHPSKWRNEP